MLRVGSSIVVMPYTHPETAIIASTGAFPRSIIALAASFRYKTGPLNSGGRRTVYGLPLALSISGDR